MRPFRDPVAPEDPAQYITGPTENNLLFSYHQSLDSLVQ
jgi:hypothetical protein